MAKLSRQLYYLGSYYRFVDLIYCTVIYVFHTKLLYNFGLQKMWLFFSGLGEQKLFCRLMSVILIIDFMAQMNLSILLRTWVH